MLYRYIKRENFRKMECDKKELLESAIASIRKQIQRISKKEKERFFGKGRREYSMSNRKKNSGDEVMHPGFYCNESEKEFWLTISYALKQYPEFKGWALKKAVMRCNEFLESNGERA